MKRPALYSLLLHLGVLMLLIIGFRNPFERTLAEQRPIMIEFVNIADKSVAPVLAPESVEEPEPESELKPEQKPEPKPEPKLEPKPEAPTQQLPEPAPEPEQKPEPKPEPESKPEPDVIPIPEKTKETPKPEIKDESKLEQKPKEQTIEKPKAKPTPPKQKAEINLDKKKEKSKSDDKTKDKKVEKDFDDLLSDLAADEKKSDTKKTTSKRKGAPADQVGDVVTASEIDAIRQKIARCWLVPHGARGAKDLVVDIDMKIAKDGTVTDAKIVDKARMASDPAFRSAAESAQRAVLDPKCNPLPLNPDKYDQWKDLTMSFNPKDMY